MHIARGNSPLPENLAAWEIWPVDSRENYWNCGHQMSDFKAKMHQVPFRLGLRPRPLWESLRRSSDSLAAFKGLLIGEGREGKGMGWREGNGWAAPRFWFLPRCRDARIVSVHLDVCIPKLKFLGQGFQKLECKEDTHRQTQSNAVHATFTGGDNVTFQSKADPHECGY